MTKLFSPSAERNRQPIEAELAKILRADQTVLEIASGSGQHAVHFARAFPFLTWQPSDVDPDACASIETLREEAGLPNLREPLRLDASADTWPIEHAEAIVAINVVHISPIEATDGLLRGAARLLPAGAPLFLYGPYLREGVVTASSNLAFDDWLKARNPKWGVRQLEDVAARASAHGLALGSVTELPANNVAVVFRKEAR